MTNFSAIASYEADWKCDICGKEESTSEHYISNEPSSVRQVKFWIDMPDDWMILHTISECGVDEHTVYCERCRKNEYPSKIREEQIMEILARNVEVITDDSNETQEEREKKYLETKAELISLINSIN